MALTPNAKFRLNLYLDSLKKEENIKQLPVLRLLEISLDTSHDGQLQKFVTQMESGDLKVQQENLEVIHLLGFCYKFGIGAASDTKRGFEIIALAAEQGHARSLNRLGDCYEHGCGVKQDSNLAFQYYKRASEFGFAPAQNHVGRCYRIGKGVKQDFELAVKYYRKAARQGYADAQNNLATCYEQGHGLKKDTRVAVLLFRYAANQGHARAQCNLGIHYEQGLGVEQDKQQALVLYTKASQAGDPVAQNNLAFCYEKGTFVKQDSRRALDIYTQAASKGCSVAQYNLAYYYWSGKETLQNKTRAILLFQLSSQQGYAKSIETMARYQLTEHPNFLQIENAIPYCLDRIKKKEVAEFATLGFCYQMGIGTKQDTDQACHYYLQAMEHGIACKQDLFFCYQANASQEPMKEEITEFYKQLILSSEKGHLEDTSLLAYLYEYGAPGLLQNLYTAVHYYQKLSAQGWEPAQSKLKQYQPLFELRKRLQSIFKENNILLDPLVSIIAEYAFDLFPLSKPSPHPRKTAH